jgi:hypothetical protein
VGENCKRFVPRAFHRTDFWHGVIVRKRTLLGAIRQREVVPILMFYGHSHPKCHPGPSPHQNRFPDMVANPLRPPLSPTASQLVKQYESLEASPPWSRIWWTLRPRKSSPYGKNPMSATRPPAETSASSFAIHAPTPSG